MKKLFVFLLLGVFMIGFASAGLFDPNSELEFHEEGKNGKYGYYEINDTDFWFFNNKPLKTIELIENDYSVLKAWNIKEIEIFKPTKLFDKTNYLDKNQNEDRSNLLSSETHLYREWQTKTRTIDNQSCLTYETSINQTQVCVDWQDNSYEETYEEWSNWEDYNFQTVQEGLYQTKTIVTRDTQGTGIIDWVDENEGWDLDEWETWWDNDWNRKRLINLTADVGNFSYIEKINHSTGMHSNFSDVRFLDSATESLELNFTIQGKVDDDYIIVRIFSQGNNSTYMYYGNPGATTSTESSSDTHFQPVSYYYLDGTTGVVLDSVGSNDATNVGATRGAVGQINKSFDFNGVSSVSMPNFGLSVFSISMWAKPDVNNVLMYLIDSEIGRMTLQAQGDGTFGLWVGSLISSGSFSTSVFSHIVITSNGSTYELWVNGVSQGTTSSSVDLGGTTKLGQRYSGGTQQYDGSIDEVTIYDYVLDEEQIIQLSNYTEPNYTVGAEDKRTNVVTTLISPENNENILNNTVSFEFTSTPSLTNLTNATLHIWNSTNDSILTNFTTLSGNESVNTTINNTLVDGMYKWNAETCGEDVECSFASSNNTFIVHVTPITINISEPNGTIEHILLGDNETLSWQLTEPGENLTEHVTNCSYTYNSVVTFLPLSTCVGTNTTDFTYVFGVNNLTFNATDQFNLTSSQTTTWDYDLITNSINFTEPTTSGLTNEFITNITAGSRFSGISVLLNYNGTNHSMSTNDTGVTREYSVALVSPSVTVPINVTFFFIALLSEGDNITRIDTAELNQTVNPFLIDNCSTFNNTLLDFEMVDEDTLQEINGTIEFTINIFSIGTTDLVNSFNNSYAYIIGQDSQVCLDNITEEYSMSYQIRHFGNEIQYFKKYRNIQFTTINNESIPENLTLYNLNLSRGNDFNVIVVGNLLSSQGNAGLLVDTQRQYLAQDRFISVESPVTDSAGVAISNLVETEEIYNFLISINGELLGTFNNYQVKCANAALGQCSITLNLASATGTQTDFETVGNVTQVIFLDESVNTLHHTFSSTDGTSKTIRSLVIKDDGFGNTTICNSTASGTSGTILCSIPVQFQNVSFFVQSFESETLLGSSYFSQGVTPDWQGVDILIMLLMFSSLVLLMIAHPVTIIIGALLGITMPVLLISVSGASFGALVGAVFFYIAAGIIAIIIISKRKI